MSQLEVISYAKPSWGKEESDALLGVLESGHWTGGHQVAQLEFELQSFLGDCTAVAVANGTLGLFAVFHCLRKTGRNLMISSTLNFTAAASAATLLGYELAFTDVSSECLTMDPASLENILMRYAHMFDNIIICPVHYAGVPCDMDTIARLAQQYEAHVVEDACHALGATYRGSAVNVGCHPKTAASLFSFHPNKTVAAGEGGAIVTKTPDIAKKLSQFRNHNMERHEPEYYWECQIKNPGLNLRLSEFHAAIGRVQLNRLAKNTEIRRGLAALYMRALPSDSRVTFIGADWQATSSHHLFPIRLTTKKLSRKEVHAVFSRHKIKPQLLYVPLHQQQAFKNELLVKSSQFLVAENLAEQLYCMPLFVDLSVPSLQRVVIALSEVLEMDQK